MKILVSGFEPFNQESINPSLEIIRALPTEIAGAQLITIELPTVYYESLNIIEKVIHQEQPDVILSLGVAALRDKISIERVAINLNDARIMDNANQQPCDELIKLDGDTAYFTNLPIRKIQAELLVNDIPTEISLSAGAFVCNHVFYGVRYLLHNSYKDKQSGFIHVPPISDTWPLVKLVRGIEVVIEAIAMKQ